MVYADPAHLHAVSSLTTSTGVLYDGLHQANFFYDADGGLQCVTANTNSSCTGSDAKDFAYTAFGMTATVGQAGSQALSLAYDPEHRRVQQVSGGVTTTYLDDPASGVMSEGLHQSGQNSWKTYLSAGGRIVAQRFTINGNPNVDMRYFVLDHLGSVVAMSDASANVTRQYYDPWGAMRNGDGTPDGACALPGASPSTRGFTNQEQMPGVCLVNGNARLYDPVLGRFLAADPTVEAPALSQDWNRYSYVVNNPLAFVDPSGNEIARPTYPPIRAKGLVELSGIEPLASSLRKQM